MKPIISSKVPIKVFILLTILLVSFTSCQNDVQEFYDEEFAKNNTNDYNNLSNQGSATQSNTDGCNNVGFALYGSIDNSDVYPRLSQLNLTRPEQNGLYSVTIQQLNRYTGSDMLGIRSYNGRPGIVFQKDDFTANIDYFGYQFFEMPDLSHSGSIELMQNNSKLPYGMYNVVQEIDLNDSEFMIVIDAPFYATGDFYRPDLWAISLISDELLTTHEMFKLFDEWDTSTSFEFVIDSYIYQSDIKLIQVELELDCGTTTKLYDRAFNLI